MGLAGEKRKQRLVGSAVTRNSAWLTDTSLPGQRLLSQMGWSEGQGIGGSGTGRTEAIKTMYKMDNKGIGSQRAEKEMRQNGKTAVGGADKWIGGGGELGGLFERLNAAAGQTTPSVTSTPVIEHDEDRQSSKEKVSKIKDKKRKRKATDEEAASPAPSGHVQELEGSRSKAKGKAKEESSDLAGPTEVMPSEEKRTKKSKKDKRKAAEEAPADEAASVERVAQTIRNASRAKYLRAKRQLYGDAISMNEILGIASGSNSPAPAPASPQVASPRTSPPLAALASETVPLMASTAEIESDKERKRREKRERRERKASKLQDKEASRAQDPRLSDEGQTRAIAEESSEKKALVVNTVSPLSVHEYLSRKLMLRKAQMARRRKKDQEAVWGRLSAGSGVGIMVE